MSLSNFSSERFLIERPISISAPETELEILPTDSGSHSFHSPLLDDIQLDLELECEEDDVAFTTRDTNYNSWNSDIIPAHLSLPPINSPNHIHNEFPYSENQRTNPTIASLIKSSYTDPKQKDLLSGEDIYSRKRSPGKLFNTFETDHYKLPTSTTLTLCKNEPTFSPSPDTFQNSCITCPLCKILFSSNRSLQVHFSEQHNKIKMEPETHQCSICGKCYGCKKNVVKHMKSHSVVKPQKCKQTGPFHCHICSYVGSKKVLLQKHLETKHNPERETFSCDLCSFSCVQERSFKVHKLTHEGVDGKFACDQCGKLFFTMNILKRHARTHSSSRPYMCDFNNCKKAFTIKSRLTDHIRTVHKRNIIEMKNTVSQEDNFHQDKIMLKSKQASVCNGEGAGTANLNSHTEKSSVNPINYNSKTTFSFESEEDESDTDRSQNHDDITIVYDIILPQSTHIEDFQIKQNESTDSMPIDPVSFSKSSASKVPGLKKSLYRAHDKKVPCSWKGCGKYFRDSYNLRKHMCTHTGEMEIACPLCRYRCVQKSALEKHMETHKNSNKCKRTENFDGVHRNSNPSNLTI